MIRLVQIVHLSSTYIALALTCLQTGRNEIPHEPRHLGVPSSAIKMFSEPMVRLTQTMHQYCIKISIIYERIETSLYFGLIT
jgi:hypothetical protein